MKLLDYLHFWLLILLLPGSGCNGILDEEVAGGMTAEIYLSTPTGVEDIVRASYTPLRDWYSDEVGLALTILGTDMFTQGENIGTLGGGGLDTYDSRLTPTIEAVELAWTNLYRGVNYTNTALARLAQYDQLPNSPVTVRRGEVRFLRALYYFTLVQTFGDVHLSTKETIGVEVIANKTAARYIYSELIIPDLLYAINHLPAHQEEYGRATRPAAEAVLARVMLVTEDWAAAEALARSVIEDYDFALAPTYAEIFAADNQRNSEMVFTVQYSLDAATNGLGNRAHLYFNPGYAREKGLSWGADQMQTLKRFKPTAYFYDLFDRRVDRRYDEGIREVVLANIDEEDLRIGDTAVVYTERTVPAAVKASAPYKIYDRADLLNIPYCSVILMKHHDNRRRSAHDRAGSKEFPVVRIAELYLMATEAAWRQGRTEPALHYINTLRSARAKEGHEQEMRITAAQLDLDFILDERGRELFAEQHRWFTLKRTGTLAQRAAAHNPRVLTVRHFHQLRPIPQSQIDLARYAGGGVYPQNPGYN